MKLFDLKPGDLFTVTDPWADCLTPGTYMVKANVADGSPTIECACGDHQLDGHVGPDGHLIGITLHKDCDL